MHATYASQGYLNISSLCISGCILHMNPHTMHHVVHTAYVYQDCVSHNAYYLCISTLCISS